MYIICMILEMEQINSHVNWYKLLTFVVLIDRCRLSTTLLFLNLQSTYSVSNVAMDSIFRNIHALLPKPNSMPASRDEARKLLSKLGLECEVIHMCENSCILFRGEELKDATIIPTCNSPRYRDDTIGEKIPHMVHIIATSFL